MSMYADGGMGHPAEMQLGATQSGSADPHLVGFEDMLGDISIDMLPMDLDLNEYSDPDPHSYHHSNHMPQEPNTSYYAQEQHDRPSGGAGAGPLPTGFGAQLGPSGGSTLTEFTKRRNWSQRVLDELKDFLYILTADGRFLYASPSCKALTGYDNSELIGKVIVDLIHPDDSSMFVREFHESIASGNPLRFFYRFRKADGTWAIFESHGHPHLASEAANFGPNSGASFCRGFFMMARPYPTKNAALLDSFLEHKIENERLRKRIAELKQEELEDQETQKQHWQKQVDGQRQPSVTATESTATRDRSNGGEHPGTSITSSAAPAASNNGTNYNGMPPPAKPGISNTALTRQNLNEALAASRPDSINDKMARYEGATHIETIEMLTGLRYREGERSHGISTGEKSPALIRGDAGITILVDKDGRPSTTNRYSSSNLDGSADKKKKTKIADEYVCTDCGTLDSPEWRKGPSGPKTLCNACGLRWAKKEKRRQTNSSGGDRGSQSAVPTGSGDSTPQGTQGQQPSPIGAGGMAAIGVMGSAPVTIMGGMSISPNH